MDSLQLSPKNKDSPKKKIRKIKTKKFEEKVIIETSVLEHHSNFIDRSDSDIVFKPKSPRKSYNSDRSRKSIRSIESEPRQPTYNFTQNDTIILQTIVKSSETIKQQNVIESG